MRKDAKYGDNSSSKDEGLPADRPGFSAGVPERSAEARRLAELIEEERRRLGTVPADALSSPAVIRRMARLEELINQFIRLGKK